MNVELVLYGGTYLNKGGAAIFYGTLSALRKIGIKFEYIIDPEPFFPFDLLKLKPIYRFSDELSITPLPTINPLCTIKPFLRCTLNSFDPKIRNLKGKSIWHIGDSPFSDTRSVFSIIGQVYALETLSEVIGGDIIIGGVSIGVPRTKFGNIFLKNLFCKYVDYTFTRGRHSSKVLEHYKIDKSKYSEICDFAFQLDAQKIIHSSEKINKLEESGKPIIALIFRDYSKGNNRERYIKKISVLVDLLCYTGYEVYFIPTTYSFLTPENDLLFIKKILKIPDSKIINIKNYHPGEIISIFQKFDLVISARLHGAIFGVLANIPTIHLWDSAKSLEVLDEVFNESVSLIGIHDFTTTLKINELLNQINSLIDNKLKISFELEKKVFSARKSTIINLEDFFQK